jgi:hypothetical protein
LFVPTDGRLLDTRAGSGTPLAAGTWRSVAVDGFGDIPDSGVSAVSIIVTAVNPSAAGNAWVASSDASDTPGVVTLVYGTGGATGSISASTIVAVGADGNIKVRTQTTQHVVIDVQGYYTGGGGAVAPGGYVPVTPKRIYDTHNGLGRPAGVLSAGVTYSFQIAGLGGIPADAMAAFIQFTPDVTGSGGYLLVRPTGSAQAFQSLNYTANAQTPIAATFDLGDSGSLDVKVSNGSIDLNVVVFGYFTPNDGTTGGFTPAAARVFDSRVAPNTAVAASESRMLPLAGYKGVPAMGSGISAVAVNIHVIHSTGSSGSMQLRGSDQSAAGPGNVWFGATGSTRSNMVIVRPGPDGRIGIDNKGSDPINVVLDVIGWYSNVGTPTAAGQTAPSGS